MSNTTPPDTTCTVPALQDIFKQLNTADFALAQLAIDLKDPDKRQEIGIKLVEAMADAFDTHGMEFSDIKMKTKGGVATVSFKFPVIAIARSLDKAQAESLPEAEPTAQP